MVGATLNHYRVTKALSSGGMGAVYLAEDTRLKRLVALKILPADFSAQPHLAERFQREAQSVAALNHPNIVTLYSVEQAGDTHFLTMEFVDGCTLADLIPKGGMPVTRLLAIATQISDAIIAAHSHGIIHRDLKPANVMVSTSDRVKVLDFGIAKLRVGAGSGHLDTNLPTRELTEEGHIVGTVAYMSPEQAQGKPVDERSDIFSLGVLLYELATGERPFKGDTTVSVLSSILKDTPADLTEINPRLPRDLSRIVRHCLAKDPERRYQSAKDLRNELEDYAQVSSVGDLAAPSKTQTHWTWPRVATFSALLFVVAPVLLLTLWHSGGAAGGPSTAPPISSHTRLTQREGIERYPSLSPDGKWVVYASDGDIYFQSVSGQAAMNLTKDSPADDSRPVFSPDGESIAFRSERDGGGIFVMGRTGESVRRLTTAGVDHAWFPDGRTLVFSTAANSSGPENRINFSDLWVVNVAGGDPRRIFAGDAVQPRVSPSGKRIAFWAVPADPASRQITFDGVAANRDIWTVDVNGEHPVRVTTHDANDWNPVWSPDGRWLYFLSNRSGSMNLWRVGLDEGSGAVSEEPQPLTLPASYVADFSLSADGRLATYSSISTTRNVARISFDAASGSTKGPVQPITTGTNDFEYIDLAPDGRSLALSTSTRVREDIYVLSTSGGDPRQLTNDFARDRAPRWSPDGRQIFFYSDRTGWGIWRVEADGAGVRQLSSPLGWRFVYPVPSPDGKQLALSDVNSREMRIYAIEDLSQPVDVLPAFPDASVAYPRVDDWSPDGQFFAISAIGRRGGLWLYSLQARTYRRVTDATNTGGASWLPGGTHLIYSYRDRLMTIDTMAGLSRETLAIEGETLSKPEVAADGSQLYFLRSRTSGDISLVQFGESKQ